MLEENLRTKTNNAPRIFSSKNIKSYLIVILLIGGIILVYYIVQMFSGGINSSGLPPIGGNNQPPPTKSIISSLSLTSISVTTSSIMTTMPTPPSQNMGQMGFSMFDIWPLWGTLVSPTIIQIIFAIIIFVVISILVVLIFRNNNNNFTDERDSSILENKNTEQNSKLKKSWNEKKDLIYAISCGFLAIFLTNLIQGWNTGIYTPVGGQSEIYTDAVNITSIWAFIKNYATLQPNLSLHAQTQPPGAVLLIYVLYGIFKDPSVIAIAISVIAAVGSSLFLYGIFKKLFNKSVTKYVVLLYLLLPAIEVYYLANIYAILATLILGMLYFYLHKNKTISIIGTFICLFLATFMSFIAMWGGLFLIVFEISKIISNRKINKQIIREVGFFKWFKNLLSSIDKLLIVGFGIIASYLLLYMFLGFNYIGVLSYASSLENPNGFMLTANPIQYFTTRIEDILDILIFFGPILIVFSYRGLKYLKKNFKNDENYQRLFLIIISALVALLILFLTGAPKKGETARICMFILPFLLIPVIVYLNKEGFSKGEKTKLLLIVFAQAVLMQTIATFIW